MTYTVTVVICTRNRGDAIRATISSVLANTYTDFDLLIVDQSSELSTAHAVAEFCGDPRLRYLHTATQGLSTARNIGLAFCHSDLVLMTDDDCEVPPDWICEMVAPFQRYPRLGMVFSDVVAGPYDHQAGFIPVCKSSRVVLIENFAHWQTCDGVNIGIGASMAIKRSAAEAVAGFNPLFGAGSYFRSGEDLDFTLRVLVAAYQVLRINYIGVIHYGFRTMQENRALMRSALYGAGAAYGSLLRRGQWLALPYYTSMFMAIVIQPLIESLRQRRVPPLFGRVVWLVRGLLEGLLIALPRSKQGFFHLPESR
ncbi:MAG: glycosyltransferase [Oscillochloris sp.]|nr:glycosyltransferase [Oscillochloris sp.]